jgi:GNAT superfamily N-acetyltransferase
MGIETVKNLRIRNGESRDIETMVTFLHHLFAIEKDFMIDADKNRVGLQLLLADPHVKTIFVAVVDNAIVGMVTAQLVVSTAAGGYSVLLEDMYVTDNMRRLGIGTALMQKVQKWGDKKGALRIQLVADERNRTALMFYRRSGFQGSGMTGLYMPLS